MHDLPHTFRDPALLALALTHASTGGEKHNERLEFLGDAVLGVLAAEVLYQRRPDLAEGELSQRKAWLVSRRVLALAARALGLGERADVGDGMRGGGPTLSVEANLYEALLGAIYLDGGIDAARAFVHGTLGASIATAGSRRAPNPKQTLQQHVQQLHGTTPHYVVLEQRGRAHARAFLAAAEVAGRRYPSAWGRTRKEAEHWAAHEALLVIADEADGASA